MASAHASLHASVDPRAGATVTLLAVAGIAAFGLTLSPASVPRSSEAAIAPTPAERTAATPVRIIGAAPRSEECDAQVWPYIEGRCLVRGAAKPARSAETTGVTPTRSTETTGTAPSAAPPSSVLPAAASATEQRPRVASIQLQLPPRRALLAAPPVNDAWADDMVEQPTYAAPRRRAGRHRGERGWGRRPMLPLFFR